jgi:hypothetical protein
VRCFSFLVGRGSAQTYQSNVVLAHHSGQPVRHHLENLLGRVRPLDVDIAHGGRIAREQFGASCSKESHVVELVCLEGQAEPVLFRHSEEIT